MHSLNSTFVGQFPSLLLTSPSVAVLEVALLVHASVQPLENRYLVPLVPFAP